MRKWLSENWFNIVTISLALFAVYLSYDANRLARSAMEESRPIIDFLPERTPPTEVIQVTGCRMTPDSSRPYMIRYAFHDKERFSNQGGRDVSLTDVYFYVDNLPALRIEQFAADDAGNKLVPRTPIHIGAGLHGVWYFDAYWQDAYGTKEEAVRATRDLATARMPTVTWEYNFNDGSILTRKRSVSEYQIHPDIVSQLEEPCE